ncbi:MAG: aminopeptidase P family protein [Leadbetterella sp.]
MRYEPIPSDFYIRNRKALSEKMVDNSIAIFCSNVYYPSSADGHFGFKQSSGFFYLTGIDQEDSFLVLIKSGGMLEEILFVLETSDHLKIWEGEKLTKTQAQNLSGIEEIRYTESFREYVKDIVKKISNVYFYSDTYHIEKKISYTFEISYYEDLKPIFKGKNVQNIAIEVDRLRLIKNPYEIRQIKKAIEITQTSFHAVAQKVAPGVHEYELEAELKYAWAKKGSRFPAFAPILASGEDSCVLHYIKNDKICKEGDVLLMDFGAEYGNYNADLTRVLPVSGRFSSRQEEVYVAVYEVFSQIKKYVKPGQMLKDIREYSQNSIGDQLIRLGLISKNTIENVKKYYMHGPSHFLGLDVHDVGERDTKLAAGMVITCEPGIYIAKEKIGIRLENDLLITQNGIEDLCEDIPLQLNDIYTLLNR